ncbi:MAG: hypothetical protein NVS9B3_03460 [Gemmatimonadaceae bacterium]
MPASHGGSVRASAFQAGSVAWRSSRAVAALLITLALTRAAAAQTPRKGVASPTPPRPAAVAPAVDTIRSLVEGEVYDSVAQAPLGSAVVQVVSALDPTSGAIATITTKADGTFSVPAVRPGRYLISFLHPALDSLGIEAPTRLFDVVAGRRAYVELAVPSGESLARAYCPARPPGDSSGVLVGFVRDAETGRPVPGADVVATWRETVIDSRGIRNTRPAAGAKAAASGFYAVCRVASGTTVLTRATTADRGTGFIEVTVPRGSVAKRDLNVAPLAVAAAPRAAGDSAAPRRVDPRRTARLAGLVRGASGTPLVGARVGLAGRLEEVATNDSGTFVLSNLPVGTRNLEIRYVGYRPKKVPVDLGPGRTTTVAVRLEASAPVLDEVRVTSNTSLQRALDDFERRRRMGFGSYISRADIEERRPLRTTDLFTTIPGVRVSQVGSGSDYAIIMNGGAAGTCQPVVFLDHMRFEPGSFEINSMVHPEEIIGIEVYRGGGMAPPEYSGNNGCGVVVIATHPLASRSTRTTR